MSLTPHVLLDTSIAQLRTLAAFLAEEMGEYRHKSEAANLEARACKEILLTISMLVAKLQAARYVATPGSFPPLGRVGQVGKLSKIPLFRR